MREQNDLGIQQPDYNKYAELKELPSGWMQLLRSMDCLKFAITAIVVIAVAAFQKNHEALAVVSIACGAIAGIVLVLGVENVTRRQSNGETFTNPTKSTSKPGNARGYQGKPRQA